MKEIKLKKLEESYESGSISKEEYEKKRKEIKEIPEEKIEKKEGNEEVKEVKIWSDKILIIGVILVLLLFAALLSLRYLPQERPETIDELHEFNLRGKLKPEQGYIYNDVYSFVKFEDLWYTQFVSPQGSRLYNIQFRYGPRDIENIKIGGSLDLNLFNNATDYYATFNPTGNNFSAVALAVSDFNQQMTNIFFKQPIAACDRNETLACTGRPVITCENTDSLVIYIKEANDLRVYYDDNCIVVEGNGFDLVKGVDRVLFNLYGVMEQ